MTPTHSPQTNRHDNHPDGLTPRETGMAILASGSVAIVAENGDVIDIMSDEYFWSTVVEQLAEDRRI